MTGDRDAAMAEASRARGCQCGRVFVGSAFAVHLEAGSGRCLPEHFWEAFLEQADGVWVTRGADMARLHNLQR